MEEIVEVNNFVDDGTSFAFSEEDHFEFGGKGKARRAERREAKAEKKAAKQEIRTARKEARIEKKQSRADLRRSKGEAKILKAQTGSGSSVMDKITQVAGGIASAVLPGGGSSEEAVSTETAGAEVSTGGAVDTVSTARTAGATTTDTAGASTEGGMSKKMKMGIYIGGGVLLVGVLAFIFLRPKKAA